MSTKGLIYSIVLTTIFTAMIDVVVDKLFDILNAPLKSEFDLYETAFAAIQNSGVFVTGTVRRASAWIVSPPKQSQEADIRSLSKQNSLGEENEFRGKVPKVQRQALDSIRFSVLFI